MSATANFLSRGLGALFALALLALCAQAYAQPNGIEAVNISSQAAGRVVVKVTLKEAPTTPPASFTVANPPRIALDFADTTNAMARPLPDVTEGDLRRVNVVQAGDRTRMIEHRRLFAVEAV